MTMLPYVLGLGVLAISLMLYLKRRGRGISLLIPFQSTDRQRRENVEWLKKYWHAQLPGAEIIIGQDRVSLADPQIPFSKSAAVNDAASRANGDIFVIVDGDGYVDAEAVLNCVNNIRRAKREGKRLWYVPYRQFYRLTKEAARRVLDSSPKQPYRFPMPPAPEDVQETSGVAARSLVWGDDSDSSAEKLFGKWVAGMKDSGAGVVRTMRRCGLPTPYTGHTKPCPCRCFISGIPC